MGVLKFKNPKVREGLNVSTIEAMRARGYDIYVCAKGKDLFINSSAWDEEKAKKLFDEYGLKSFRDSHLQRSGHQYRYTELPHHSGYAGSG